MDDEYWKKPEPVDGEIIRSVPGVGAWSRSFALRATVWIITILIVMVLALMAAAYLSGFGSVVDMLSWLKMSISI